MSFSEERPRNVQAYPFYPYGGTDPVIDQIKRMMLDLGVDVHKASRLSGVSVMTFNNWFSGVTRNPKHKTVQAVTRALQINPGELRMPQQIPDWNLWTEAVDEWHKGVNTNMAKHKPPTPNKKRR